MTADELFNLYRNIRGYEDWEKRHLRQRDRRYRQVRLPGGARRTRVCHQGFRIIEKALLEDTYAVLEKSIRS